MKRIATRSAVGRGTEGRTMQHVLIYALGAILAAGMAWFSGPATPPLVFWLYVIGAGAFALAAVGQYFKLQNTRR
jgi:hypothetical protein